MILRFIRCKSGKWATVREFFVVNDTTGSGLLETLLKRIEELGLDIQDSRGQGYDNGSNMRGKTQGVQARFIYRRRRLCGLSMIAVERNAEMSHAILITALQRAHRRIIRYEESNT